MTTKKDSLGDRMKEFYENRTRTYLPRRTHTIIRIDGKAFHTYTKGLKRPFDENFIEDMNNTTKFLCENIQGAVCGFVQSDEISILLTDYKKLGTAAWFDGNIQKICSISASMATAKFNELRTKRHILYKMSKTKWNKVNNETFTQGLEQCFNLNQALFDSRVFIIPQDYEVENYFVWRQQDTVRNSIESVAQSLYSQKELHGVNCDKLQEMIFQKGINWNDYPVRNKRGGFCVKVERTLETSFVNDDLKQHSYQRSNWEFIDTPIFTQQKGIITDLLK